MRTLGAIGMLRLLRVPLATLALLAMLVPNLAALGLAGFAAAPVEGAILCLSGEAPATSQAGDAPGCCATLCQMAACCALDLSRALTAAVPVPQQVAALPLGAREQVPATDSTSGGSIRAPPATT